MTTMMMPELQLHRAQETEPSRAVFASRTEVFASRPESPSVVAAPARLVAETRSAFRDHALERLARIAARGDRAITVDLGATREVDASGLGVLLFLSDRARAVGVRTRLAHVPAPVHSLLVLTRLVEVFDRVD